MTVTLERSLYPAASAIGGSLELSAAFHRCFAASRPRRQNHHELFDHLLLRMSNLAQRRHFRSLSKSLRVLPFFMATTIAWTTANSSRLRMATTSRLHSAVIMFEFSGCQDAAMFLLDHTGGQSEFARRLEETLHPSRFPPTPNSIP